MAASPTWGINAEHITLHYMPLPKYLEIGSWTVLGFQRHAEREIGRRTSRECVRSAREKQEPREYWQRGI